MKWFRPQKGFIVNDKTIVEQILPKIPFGGDWCWEIKIYSYEGGVFDPEYFLILSSEIVGKDYSRALKAVGYDKKISPINVFQEAQTLIKVAETDLYAPKIRLLSARDLEGMYRS